MNHDYLVLGRRCIYIYIYVSIYMYMLCIRVRGKFARASINMKAPLQVG